MNNKCPEKINEECYSCDAHCYCDKWKGFDQGINTERKHHLVLTFNSLTELNKAIKKLEKVNLFDNISDSYVDYIDKEK